MCDAQRIAEVVNQDLLMAQRIIERQRTEISQLRESRAELQDESDRRNEVLVGWISRANQAEALVAQMRAVLA